MDIKTTTIIGGSGDGDEKTPTYSHDIDDANDILITENVDSLKRRLSGRQIQMITIGGSIGTALFVSIGSGLVAGGPGSLFIAFVIYCCFLAAVNNCMAEMAVFMPVSGSFVRMGSKVCIFSSTSYFLSRAYSGVFWYFGRFLLLD